MVNEIKMVRGEPLNFGIVHLVNDEPYVLSSDEKYRIKLKRDLHDDEVFTFESSNNKFYKGNNLDVGEYCFEISIVEEGSDVGRVISPVTDKNGVIVNKLYVTERL